MWEAARADPVQEEVERRADVDLRAGKGATEPDSTTVDQIGHCCDRFLFIARRFIHTLDHVEKGGVCRGFHGLLLH